MSAPLRVLLVDDAPEVRRLLRTALRLRPGFEVVGEASSGTSAVTLTADLRPDVVVLDLGLPDLAGREVLGRLRQHSPRSKVVVFSGGEPLDHPWIAERADGFVVKDAELDQLLDLLAEVGQASPDAVVLDLPEDPASAGRARRAVREALASWQQQGAVDDALIVVSEMVTNAVRHGAPPVLLQVVCEDDRVLLAVGDGSERLPVARDAGEDAEGGRGMALVDLLAVDHGVQPGPPGKTVWATVRRSS